MFRPDEHEHELPLPVDTLALPRHSTDPPDPVVDDSMVRVCLFPRRPL
jgi:hypothetical protein